MKKFPLTFPILNYALIHTASTLILMMAFLSWPLRTLASTVRRGRSCVSSPEDADFNCGVQPSMGATRILQLSVVALMVEGFRADRRGAMSPLKSDLLSYSCPQLLSGW